MTQILSISGELQGSITSHWLSYNNTFKNPFHASYLPRNIESLFIIYLYVVQLI
jgi:hypothetical protein